jgi:hypothetical protein
MRRPGVCLYTKIRFAGTFHRRPLERENRLCDGMPMQLAGCVCRCRRGWEVSFAEGFEAVRVSRRSRPLKRYEKMWALFPGPLRGL